QFTNFVDKLQILFIGQVGCILTIRNPIPDYFTARMVNISRILSKKMGQIVHKKGEMIVWCRLLNIFCGETGSIGCKHVHFLQCSPVWNFFSDGKYTGLQHSFQMAIERRLRYVSKPFLELLRGHPFASDKSLKNAHPN